MTEAEIQLKPLLKVENMVPYLENKNISFEFISKKEVEHYLKYNNNYYNVTSYRNNFERYTSGENTRKFLDLDFAYLIDMAIIDMHLRILLLEIILDIEHYLKMKILNEVEYIEEEDGYKIVNMFLQEDYDDKKRVHKSILEKTDGEYYSKILSEYGINKDTDLIQNIPLWVFLEIITVGELRSFYDFYSTKYNFHKNMKYVFMLKEVNRLRNAVAHNTCILNNLKDTNNESPIRHEISQFLSKCNISKDIRDIRMSNSRIRQIVYTLYMFDNIVTSSGIKKNVYIKIDNLFYNRILHHCEYYQTNEMLKSVYNFFDKIILTLMKNEN